MIIIMLLTTLLYFWAMNLEAETTGKGSIQYNRMKTILGSAVIVGWTCLLIINIITWAIM